jgi:hypothetical protein
MRKYEGEYNETNVFQQKTGRERKRNIGNVSWCETHSKDAGSMTTLETNRWRLCRQGEMGEQKTIGMRRYGFGVWILTIYLHKYRLGQLKDEFQNNVSSICLAGIHWMEFNSSFHCITVLTCWIKREILTRKKKAFESWLKLRVAIKKWDRKWQQTLRQQWGIPSSSHRTSDPFSRYITFFLVRPTLIKCCRNIVGLP